MIRWQGNFYYLREQNNTAFLEIPSGMQITLEKDSRGYDPNHIKSVFAPYLRLWTWYGPGTGQTRTGYSEDYFLFFLSFFFQDIPDFRQ